MDLIALREKRGSVLEQAQNMLDKITTEKREAMTPEEEQRFDALHAEAEKLRGLIDRAQRHDDVWRAAEASRGRKTEPTWPSDEGPGLSSRRGGDEADATRVDLAPDQSVRAYLEQRGLLKAPREYQQVTFG